MTVRTYIDDLTGIGVQQIIGALSMQEVVSAQRKLYVELGFDPANPCLWDATEGDVAGTMSASQMQAAAEQSEPLWAKMEGGKTAILVSNAADFGMGRMYEQIASNMPRSLRVFYSRAEAMAWLTEP